MAPKRVRLSLEMKHAVIKCYKKIESLTPMGRRSKSSLESTVAEIFSISQTQVRTLLSCSNRGISIKQSRTGRKPKLPFFSDHYFKESLNQKIQEYHKNNQYFTLNDLLRFAKNELEYTGGYGTLNKIVKSMGYKYKKVNGRKILVESKEILAKKITFLKKYQQYMDENVLFVFLDESWLYENGNPVRMWVNDNNRKGNPSKVRKGDGKRFTVLHAGSMYGFLNGCAFILDSKIEHRDYHRTMNGDTFRSWVEDQLIPALNGIEQKVVVVMDNAPYHSVQIDKPPNSSSSKAAMVEWLESHNVSLNEGQTKKQLWVLIRDLLANKIEKKYVVDELLFRKGIEVLRLPPYHCQYNPIEMVWGFCKTYYSKHINSQPSSKDKVKNLWLEALSKYTSEMWEHSVQHCEKLIKDDWRKLMGDFSIRDIPPFIISLGESDSDSDFGIADELYLDSELSTQEDIMIADYVDDDDDRTVKKVMNEEEENKMDAQTSEEGKINEERIDEECIENECDIMIVVEDENDYDDIVFIIDE